MFLKVRMFAIGFLLAIANTAFPQEFEDFVAAYTGYNGVQYLQPLGNALGANLNSGLFRAANIPKMGFNLEIGLVATATMITSAEKTFVASPDPSFKPAGASTIDVPTVFGSTRSVTQNGEGGTAITYPGGIDISMLPILLPQVRLGGILGTDFTVRYFALDIDEELGSLNLFGYGIRHSISQYLPDAFPLDLALGYYHHNLDLENFSETITNLVNLQTSIRKGVLGGYAAIGYETSGNTFSYTYTGGSSDEEIILVLEDQESFRLTLGALLKIGPMFLNVDYNLGINQVLSLGLGLEFGNK